MPDTHYENQAVVAKARTFSLTKREADLAGPVTASGLSTGGIGSEQTALQKIEQKRAFSGIVAQSFIGANSESSASFVASLALQNSIASARYTVTRGRGRGLDLCRRQAWMVTTSTRRNSP